MKKNKIYVIVLAIIMLLNLSLIKVSAAVQDEKIVYLTFDDGPSPTNTNNILDVLNQNNVRGTFFVVGTNVKLHPNTLNRMNKQGMAIYPHCNNHTYKQIYSSKDGYFNDLDQCTNLINQTLNTEMDFDFIRMPGGSDNHVSNNEVLESIREGIICTGKSYIDWNIDSGDACAMRVSTENIKNNMKLSAGTYKIEVVLMHDTENKDTTCDALRDVINDYKALGYKFKTLNEIEDWEVNYLKKIRVIDRR